MAEHNKWYCDGCGSVLGKMRPAANGGRFLDLIGSDTVVLPRDPVRPGVFSLACSCGFITAWSGEAVNIRR